MTNLSEEKLNLAYEEFEAKVLTFSPASQGFTDCYRVINYTLSELKRLRVINKNVGTLIDEYMDRAIILLEMELDLLVLWLEKPELFAKGANILTCKFYWNGNKTEFVELAYSIHATQRVNDGELGEKEFVMGLAEVFNVHIPDCYNLYRKIKNRTGNSRTPYIDELKDKFERKMILSEKKLYG